MRQLREGASKEMLRVAGLGRRGLEEIMVRGDTPDPAKLAGWEFRGTNTPAWAKLAGIKKFMKGFFFDDSKQLWGYNMPIRQTALSQPWILQKPEQPKRFGFYQVNEVDAESRDNAYLHALLLDYGKGGNKAYDPTGTLRDYLVRVERGSDDLLLGKAYVAVGPARVPVSYFVLERQSATEFRRA
jgi:hypothetical protein